MADGCNSTGRTESESREAVSTAALALHHPADGGHQFLRLVIRGLGSALTADQAVAHVAVQKAERHFVQSGPRSSSSLVDTHYPRGVQYRYPRGVLALSPDSGVVGSREVRK